jgi:hypothetical protein
MKTSQLIPTTEDIRTCMQTRFGSNDARFNRKVIGTLQGNLLRKLPASWEILSTNEDLKYQGVQEWLCRDSAKKDSPPFNVVGNLVTCTFVVFQTAPSA